MIFKVKGERKITMLEIMLIGAVLLTIILITSVAELRSMLNPEKENTVAQEEVVTEPKNEVTNEAAVTNSVNENKAVENTINTNTNTNTVDSTVSEMENKVNDFIKENSTITPIESAVINIDNYTEDEPMKLNIDHEIVQELYKYVSIYKDGDGSSHYTRKKVTVKDFDEDFTRDLIFTNIKEYQAIEAGVHKNRAPLYNVPQEIVEMKAKKIYGPDFKIEHKSYQNENNDEEVTFENGCYYNVVNLGEMFPKQVFGDMYLVKAEWFGDEVYLYDKNVFIVHEEDENGWPTGRATYYGTSDHSVVLAENIEVNANSLTGGATGMSGDLNEMAKIKLENLNELYLDGKLLTFKHTFKRNDDGSFYWYSSEPVQ